MRTICSLVAIGAAGALARVAAAALAAAAPLAAATGDFTSALNVQPTPQYAHVVSTAFSALPTAMSDFSVSAPVGHASTHAPQETHSDSRNGSSWLAETFEPKPRP